jgi:hypothetical protein
VSESGTGETSVELVAGCTQAEWIDWFFPYFARWTPGVREGVKELISAAFTARPLTARPLADPTETLALIAEYRLTVMPDDIAGHGWQAVAPSDRPPYHFASGPSIADAVTECVSKIRGQQ